MSMVYCSLSEAFAVPSFDPRHRRNANNARAAAPSVEAPPSSAGREGFLAAPLVAPPGIAKAKYAAKAQDIDFGCSTYGVCPRSRSGQPIRIEAFSEEAKPEAAAPCSSAQQAPYYELPVSPQAQRASEAVVDAAMTAHQGGGAPPAQAPAPHRRPPVDMRTVEGYDDDDVDAYLSSRKAAPARAALAAAAPPLRGRGGDDGNAGRAAEPYDPEASPFSELIARHRTGALGYPAAPRGGSAPSAECGRRQVVWDLLMFAAAGVLVLLLCDQLFRAAAYVGMRETVAMLAPLLAEAGGGGARA